MRWFPASFSDNFAQIRKEQRQRNCFGWSRNQSELIFWQSPAKIMDKSHGTLLHLWEFLFQFTHDQPFPYPANSVGRVYPEFFRVSTLCRVRKERTAIKFRKGCTVCFIRATRNYRKLWILHHCTKDFCPGLKIIAKKKKHFNEILLVGLFFIPLT